jgi:hypothetical protein
MDDDDLDILNDADELAFFDKLDRIGGGTGTLSGIDEGDEEEELLVIPSKSKDVLPLATSSSQGSKIGKQGAEESKNDYSTGAAPVQRDSTLASSTSKKEVKFQPLEGIQSFQERNRALIRAQANFLHPRAVLFVGSVMSVTIPSSAPFDVEDAELLYRVLFVEGGNQPAMFRCKTPVFTSSAIPLVHHVAVWDDHTFRFDMLMPDAEAGEDPHYLNIQGEVLLSLYRKKTNGGNDLVAQFSVDLSRMKLRGTKEIFEKDVDGPSNDHLEGRSMNGVFPLQLMQPNAARKGDDTTDGGVSAEGEIEIQFNMAWHRDDPRGDAGGGGDGASLDGRNSLHSRARSSSAGLHRPSQASATAAGRSKTMSAAAAAAGTAAASQRPKSATATATVKKIPQVSATNQYKYEQPRKIVSRLDRQRKETERKIARENQLLHAKIAKQVPDQGPGKSQASSTTQNKLTAYQNYDAALSASKKAAADAAATATNPRIVNLPPNVLEKESPQWQQWQRLYEQLKKDVREEENRVQDLRAKLSNINTHIQRQEAGADRATKLMAQAMGTSSGSVSVAGGGGLRTKTTALADGKEQQALLRASRDSKIAPGEEPMESARRSPSTMAAAEVPDEAIELGTWAQKAAYMPGHLENVQDGEYRQLAEEYQVLQKLRRSLLERIAEAKQHSGTAVSQRQEMDDKLVLVKQRLWHLKQHHADDFGSIVLLKEAPPMAASSSSSSSRREAKDTSVTTATATEDDLTMYDRLLSIRSETATIQLQGGFTLASVEGEMERLPFGPAHPEVLALRSTRSELEAVVHKLTAQIDRAKLDIARLQQEQTDKVALVSDVASQREWIERRSFIAEMRAMEMRLKREERLHQLAESAKDIDLQMIHFRMLSKEREELRAQKEHLDQQDEEHKKFLGSVSRPRSPAILSDNP